MNPKLFIGTYARKGGEGLYIVGHGDSGGWTKEKAFAAACNASFATFSRRHRLYYFVDENAAGTVGVYRHADGNWQTVAVAPSGGEEPCYVALSPDETRLAVANYANGSIALFALDEHGLPAIPPTVCQNAGMGPVEDRQDGPHAHCVCFAPDGKHLFHVDLGTDQILAYALTRQSVELGERSIAYQDPPGSGPRHLAFHPHLPMALLVSELASNLTALAVDGPQLSRLHCLSTLPGDFQGESLGGHLSISSNGERVYASNRGHDSIAVFDWAADGSLHLVQHISSGGSSPRAFVLLEDQALFVVAHEEDGTLAIFNMRDDGTLASDPHTLSIPGAAFPIVVE